MAKHELLEHVDEEKLRNYLNAIDGRAYWEPAKFIRMGFPKKFVDRVTHDHATDPEDPMSWIFDPKRVKADPEGFAHSLTDGTSEKYTKEHLVAVADLSFLGELASAFGVECDHFFGSGTQADEYARRLLDYLDGKAQAPLRSKRGA